MKVYRFIVEAERERFMESPLRDKSEHYIAAYTYDQAHSHVWGMLERAGWKVLRMSGERIILQDARELASIPRDEKKIVIDSLENAWSALACQYVDSPDENTRRAINLLAGMVKEIRSRIEEHEESERKKQEQISTQEWIDWLKNA